MVFEPLAEVNSAISLTNIYAIEEKQMVSIIKARYDYIEQYQIVLNEGEKIIQVWGHLKMDFDKCRHLEKLSSIIKFQQFGVIDHSAWKKNGRL